jgi:beta-lactam-binding protein with PASTA domain
MSAILTAALPIMTAVESNAPRMPLVIGMNLARAQVVISTAIADPQVTVQYGDSGTMPPGTVIGQRPVPGNALASGSHIELTVSTAPAQQGREG